jgi:hypothetical protein
MHRPVDRCHCQESKYPSNEQEKLSARTEYVIRTSWSEDKKGKMANLSDLNGFFAFTHVKYMAKFNKMILRQNTVWRTLNPLALSNLA